MDKPKMINLFKFVILFCLSICFSDAQAEEKTSLGVHGMLVFGNQDGLYASHLPMFHAPHDYQVVLRLRLQDTVQDARLRQALARRTQVWSLEPQAFDLQRLEPAHAQPLHAFSAQIYRGHFERGGQVYQKPQMIKIEEVLIFRKLDPAAQAAGLKYQVLGAGLQGFLLKTIAGRPDFDHVLSFTLPAGFAPVSNKLHLPAHAARGQSAPSAASLQQALQAQLHPQARLGNTIYFESGDLR